MSWIKDCFNYLFYGFFKIAKEIYSKELGPAFYASHAVLVVLVFSNIPLLALVNSKLMIKQNLLIRIELVIIVILWWIFSNKHFSEKNAIKIYKYFNGNNNKSFKIFWILYILIQLFLWNYLETPSQ